MSLPKGAAEQEIRTAVVEKARQLWPSARIIHELNVEHGSTRADVAVVTNDKLILFEIKSARDKLDRLDDQVTAFESVAHCVVVVGDAKWFVPPPPIVTPQGWTSHPNPEIIKIVAGRAVLWKHDAGSIIVERDFRSGRQWPWHKRMLFLLWRAELERVCFNLRIAVGKRPSRIPMVDQIMSLAKPQEIEAAVLEQLRLREFKIEQTDKPHVAA